MAVKRYDGSAWQTVAGLGAQGPAATSSSIATWVKTASGGETSVSGNDDNSQPLSYTVGQELVFINGVLQKRGDDYTATTGNSITGLTALTAGDIVSVWTVNAFSVTNAISNTLVDAKGDLLTASSADVPARLAVGANDTVLTADSSTATGLKWAAPAGGGKILQVVTASTTTSTNLATSYADVTNMTLTITPTKNTSTIMILWSSNVYGSIISYDDALPTVTTQLFRGATSLATNRVMSNESSATGGNGRNHTQAFAFHYIDNPATTSATTYKFQAIRTNPGGTTSATIGGSYQQTITAFEIGA